MEDRDNYKFFARTPGDDGKRSVHCTDIFGCQCKMGDALNSLIFELLEEYCGLPLALSTILCK